MTFQLAPGCVNEQAAAAAFGYTQVSWDNDSGQEAQPASTNKDWAMLTENERAAAMMLGYTAASWDDNSGKETKPAAAKKFWSQLTVCGEDLTILQS